MKPQSRQKAPLDLIAFAKDSARLYFGKFGEHPPVLIAKIGGHIEVFGTAFGADSVEEVQDQKDKWTAFMEHVARKADEMVFIVECWMKRMPAGTTDAEMSKIIGRVGEQPGRTEAVRIQWATPGQQKNFSADIHRYGDAKPVLGEWVEQTAPETGRFCQIFQKARKHERN